MKVPTLTAIVTVALAVSVVLTTIGEPDDAHAMAVVDIKPPAENQDVKCLAKAIYHEARGEKVQGQIAVGYSVINRVNDSRFPNEICKVVFQKAQYSHIDTAKFDKQSDEWYASVEVANNVLNNKVKDPTNGAKFYYNPKKVTPYWKKYGEGKITDIGNHRFIHNVRNK